jgi:hypothetical protein
MEDALKSLHEGLNNAYVIFGFILGTYAAYLAGRNLPISGNFWGAMWTNTGLAAAVLGVALILAALGVTAHRVVYYLYAVYFVISLPGLFAALRGNDDRRAALFFGVVAYFNAAAAYRAGSLLAVPWR